MLCQAPTLVIAGDVTAQHIALDLTVIPHTRALSGACADNGNDEMEAGVSRLEAAKANRSLRRQPSMNYSISIKPWLRDWVTAIDVP